MYLSTKRPRVPVALAYESRVGLLLRFWLGPEIKIGMCYPETTRLSQLPDTDTDTDKGWGETAAMRLHLRPHSICSPLALW